MTYDLILSGVLTGIFYQIENSGEELVRERCIQFLNLKLPTLGSDIITTEVETLIITEAKKILQVIVLFLVKLN